MEAPLLQSIVAISSLPCSPRSKALRGTFPAPILPCIDRKHIHWSFCTSVVILPASQNFPLVSIFANCPSPSTFPLLVQNRHFRQFACRYDCPLATRTRLCHWDIPWTLITCIRECDTRWPPCVCCLCDLGPCPTYVVMTCLPLNQSPLAALAMHRPVSCSN